jgi:hypothetical protein
MNKWEYVTLHITYDKKKHKNWVVNYANDGENANRESREFSLILQKIRVD